MQLSGSDRLPSAGGNMHYTVVFCGVYSNVCITCVKERRQCGDEAGAAESSGVEETRSDD